MDTGRMAPVLPAQAPAAQALTLPQEAWLRILDRAVPLPAVCLEHRTTIRAMPATRTRTRRSWLTASIWSLISASPVGMPAQQATARTRTARPELLPVKRLSNHKNKGRSHRPRPLFFQKLYSVQRLKINDPFVPPNPKEFERAISNFACRDRLGT